MPLTTTAFRLAGGRTPLPHLGTCRTCTRRGPVLRLFARRKVHRQLVVGSSERRDASRPAPYCAAVDKLLRMLDAHAHGERLAAPCANARDRARARTCRAPSARTREHDARLAGISFGDAFGLESSRLDRLARPSFEMQGCELGEEAHLAAGCVRYCLRMLRTTSTSRSVPMWGFACHEDLLGGAPASTNSLAARAANMRAFRCPWSAYRPKTCPHRLRRTGCSVLRIERARPTLKDVDRRHALVDRRPALDHERTQPGCAPGRARRTGLPGRCPPRWGAARFAPEALHQPAGPAASRRDDAPSRSRDAFAVRSGFGWPRLLPGLTPVQLDAERCHEVHIVLLARVNAAFEQADLGDVARRGC